MNKTFNLYDLRDFKAVGSDLVSPWIGDLLDINEQAGPDFKRPAQILAYPVEKILTPATDEPSGNAVSDIRVVSSITGSSIKEALQANPAPVPVPVRDPEKLVSYFTFISGNSLYAIPSLNINEIIAYKLPASIFSKKAGHLGIILYRNRMVPVYDFSVIASGQAMDVKNAAKYIIICAYNNKFFGLSVSDIKKITSVKNKSLIAPSTFKFRNSSGVLSDVFEEADGKFCSVIDMESVYSYLTS